MAKWGWRGAVGVVITFLLLWWVLRGVPLQAVWEAMRGVSLPLLTLAVAMATGTFLLRALRWKLLLEPVRPGTRLHSRFAAVAVGFMANNLLPARMGEFARAFALSRLEPVPVGGAFASLVVERFLDGLAILTLFFLALAAPSFPWDHASGSLSLGGVIRGVSLLLGGLLAFMVLLLVFPRPLVRGAETLARRLPGRRTPTLVVETLEAFLSGLGVLRRPRLLALSLLWSLAVWGWHSLAFWTGFRAFGIHVGWDAALFTNALVAFAVGVPSAPGFFGTFHWGVKLALGVYGVSAPATLAFAFGFHLGGFIPVTLLGLHYLGRMGLSLREVRSSESRVIPSQETAGGPGKG